MDTLSLLAAEETFDSRRPLRFICHQGRRYGLEHLRSFLLVAQVVLVDEAICPLHDRVMICLHEIQVRDDRRSLSLISGAAESLSPGHALRSLVCFDILNLLLPRREGAFGHFSSHPHAHLELISINFMLLKLAEQASSFG